MKLRHARAALLAAIVGLSGASLLALERATFILSNGERMDGEVVFHTEAHTNIRADKNEFNLKTSDGIERPIPFSQVIAIDFVGGRPSPDELQALGNPGAEHVMTLRNGGIRRGRLEDLINGDTVRFDQRNGAERDIPISQVKRIYLQPDRAREYYQTGGAAGGGGFGARRGRGRFGAGAGGGNTANMRTIGTVTVRGTQQFTNTGITVQSGEFIGFEATGQITYSRDRDASVGPEGRGDATTPRAPLPDLPIGALIGKVGPNGTPFLIGNATTGVAMPASGVLMLGINDDRVSDNSGSFQVVVKR
jgi:hypothetical protein